LQSSHIARNPKTLPRRGLRVSWRFLNTYPLSFEQTIAPALETPPKPRKPPKKKAKVHCR